MTLDKKVEVIVEKLFDLTVNCKLVPADIRDTLTQYHQDLMSEVLKEIDEANWHMHLATKSRLKTFIKTIIKSK